MWVGVSFDPLEEQMDVAVQRGVFPGAVLLVKDGTRVFYLRAFGQRALEPLPAVMQEDTIFDVSSLTKPLATTVAMMLLVRDGKVRLDDRVTRFFHNFGVHGKTHVTFRTARHSSGLPRAAFQCDPCARRRGERSLSSAARRQALRLPGITARAGVARRQRRSTATRLPARSLIE